MSGYLLMSTICDRASDIAPARPIPRASAKTPLRRRQAMAVLLTKAMAWRLAHVPEKWEPVFRKGHAQTQQSRAHRDSIQSGRALAIFQVAGNAVSER